MRRSTRPRGGARWGRRTLAVRRAAACFLLPRVSSRGVISSARRLRASRVVGGHEARISSARASRPARATRALARRRGEARRRVRERRQESTIGCLTTSHRTDYQGCIWYNVNSFFVRTTTSRHSASRACYAIILTVSDPILCNKSIYISVKRNFLRDSAARYKSYESEITARDIDFTFRRRRARRRQMTR